jgi:hypothetical protein
MKWITLALLVSVGTARAQDTKFSDKEITAWSAVQEELTACTAYWQRFKACAPELLNGAGLRVPKASQL